MVVNVLKSHVRAYEAKVKAIVRALIFTGNQKERFADQ